MSAIRQTVQAITKSSISKQRGTKIIGIGRNYADHINELKNEKPKEPFFFLKPITSIIHSGETLEIPRGIVAHHEVELAVIIGEPGRDISEADAEKHISGYALAVDMTARNLQDAVKKKSLPWSAVKGFDTFTPISDFIPKSAILDPHKLGLTLKVNGATVQDGFTGDMLFRIPRLIQHVSSIMTLQEGDIILTGTPSGVGPVIAGDKVVCSLTPSDGQESLADLEFDAKDREGGYHFTGL